MITLLGIDVRIHFIFEMLREPSIEMKPPTTAWLIDACRLVSYDLSEVFTKVKKMDSFEGKLIEASVQKQVGYSSYS